MKKQKNNDAAIRLMQKIANELNTSRFWDGDNISKINFIIEKEFYTKDKTTKDKTLNIVNIYVKKGSDCNYHVFENKRVENISIR